MLPKVFPKVGNGTGDDAYMLDEEEEVLGTKTKSNLTESRDSKYWAFGTPSPFNLPSGSSS
jgi:hypothetical protein